MKEFKGYRGNKNFDKARQEIINLIPPHIVYGEFFVVGGAIYRHKKPSLRSILNDIDPTVVSIWKKNIAASTEVFNCSAEKLLVSISKKYKASDLFIYLDPPYPISSRRSSKAIYDYEMTDNDHIQLLKTLLEINKLGIKMMISTYENNIYSKYLKDWSKYTFKTSVHGKVATEVLFFNYGYPTELHDYQNLGKDCWDRQRINRKVDRQVKKLSNLPVLERNKIINAINNEFVTKDIIK